MSHLLEADPIGRTGSVRGGGAVPCPLSEPADRVGCHGRRRDRGDGADASSATRGRVHGAAAAGGPEYVTPAGDVSHLPAEGDSRRMAPERRVDGRRRLRMRGLFRVGGAYRRPPAGPPRGRPSGAGVPYPVVPSQGVGGVVYHNGWHRARPLDHPGRPARPAGVAGRGDARASTDRPVPACRLRCRNARTSRSPGRAPHDRRV
jgi:hypothetical protein